MFIAYMAAINCKYGLGKCFIRDGSISHKCMAQFYNAAFLASIANEEELCDHTVHLSFVQ